MTYPTQLGKLTQTLNPLRRSIFITLIALGNKSKILHKLLPTLGKLPLRLLRIYTLGNTLQHGNFGITQQYLKTHAYLMNPVIDGLQLTAFVHHILRCGYLAAVVQPCPDAKLPPLSLPLQPKLCQLPTAHLTRLFSQHNAQLRNPLTVATRIRTLGVDGACN